MFTPGRLWDCCVTQSQLKQEIGLCTNPKAPALADKHSRHSLLPSPPFGWKQRWPGYQDPSRILIGQRPLYKPAGWLELATGHMWTGEHLQRGEHQKGLREASYWGLCRAKIVRRCFCACATILLVHICILSALRFC
jgi:hypothetical protein